MDDFYFYVAIGLVAVLYSSVGHGGASGYLAVMTLYGFAPAEMRSSALLLNLIVSGIAWVSYSSVRPGNKNKLIPFLLGSVPAAFLGALMQTSTPFYKALLGCVLLIAVLRLVLSVKKNDYETREIPFLAALFGGAGIGFISGMIGIGGGILLSPLLILMRWATIKDSACLSAAFIFINSLAGFAGVTISGIHLSGNLAACILLAFAGGVLGSSMGSRIFPVRLVKYTLMVVLLFAGFRLLVG